MGIEIEKKYRLPIERLDAARTALSEAGAELQGTTLEENIIYGGGILDEQSAVLRVRKTPEKTLLTFKRRVEKPSDVKYQIEHESEFLNSDELQSILEVLGFERRIVYEKHRETWIFRNVEIVIDRLPFGLFIEVEGPVDDIRETEMLFVFDQLETEHETYPQLTVRLGSLKHGIIEARF